MVYTEDVTGNEIYAAHVINAETREPIEKPLVSVASNVEWAGDDALLYMTHDETLREYKVLIHIVCKRYCTVLFLNSLS